MKNIRTLATTAAITGLNTVMYFGMAVSAKAAEAPVIEPGDATTTTTADLTTQIKNILQYGIDLLLIIAGAVALIFLIWNGFQYITAGGDAAKAKTARAGIINAIIGIVVIFSAFVIIRFAYSIFNTAKNEIQ